MEACRTFSIRDTVRLLKPHGNIPAESTGSVLGWFLDRGTYMVNFAHERDRTAEVDADQIVLAEPS